MRWSCKRALKCSNHSVKYPEHNEKRYATSGIGRDEAEAEKKEQKKVFHCRPLLLGTNSVTRDQLGPNATASATRKHRLVDNGNKRVVSLCRCTVPYSPPLILFPAQQCIRAPPKRGKRWEIHPVERFPEALRQG